MPKAKIDYSIERQGHVGGTYRRRLDDAFKALRILNVERLPPEAALIFYFSACVKVAKVMIGIARRKPGQGVAFSEMKWQCSDLIRAAKRIGCEKYVSDNDIKIIFVGDRVNRFSATAVRNRVLHDLGPSHVSEAKTHAPKLIEVMKRFLECRDLIISLMK